MKKIYLLLLFLGVTQTFSQKFKPVSDCLFYENKGQITDQNGNANTGVLYLFNSGGLNVQIRKEGFSYDVYEEEKTPRETNSKNSAFIDENSREDFEKFDFKYQFHRVDVQFLGANKNLKIIAEGKSLDYDNYYNIPHQPKGISQVYRYQKIIYKNIYPRIDLVFFKSKDSAKTIEYNFIVHPGGKVSDIRLKFNGAETLLKDGRLTMKLSFGEMQENIPRSWIQQRRGNIDIAVGYREIEKSVFGFSSPVNSSNHVMVIDPVPTRLWGSYVGNPVTYGKVKTDAENYVYAYGDTSSADNIATSGAFQVFTKIGRGAFVNKISKDGKNRLWGVYYSKSNNSETFNDITFDEDYNVYAGGQLYFSVENSAAVMLKLDRNGQLLHEEISNGDSFDMVTSLAYDNGKIYAALRTGSSNLPTFNAFQPNLKSFESGYLASYDKNFRFLWGTYFSGNDGYNTIISKIFSVEDDVHIMGFTDSKSLPLVNAFSNSKSSERYDLYYAKFSKNGNLLLSTYLNVGCNRNYRDVFDGRIINNTLWLTGELQIPKGDFDAGTVRVDLSTKSLSIHYFKLFHSNGFSSYIDRYGNFYFSANGPNTLFRVSPNSYSNANAGSYFVKFDNDYNFVWGTYYSFGSKNSYITKDSEDSVYFSGETFNDFTGITTPGVFQSTSSGYTYNGVMYIAKFSECDSGIKVSYDPLCTGDDLQLRAEGGDTFLWTGPNGFTSTEQNPLIRNAQKTDSGEYFVQATGRNTCGGIFSVVVTVNDTAPPTGKTVQQFCTNRNAQIKDLEVTGTRLKFYDASGNIFNPDTVLQDKTSYFVSQTLNGCESPKLEIKVTLFTFDIPANDYSTKSCYTNNPASRLVDLSQYQENIISNSKSYTFEYFDARNNPITDFRSRTLQDGLNNFTIKVSFSNGCFKTVKLSIQLNAVPEISMSETVEFCSNSSTELDAGDGYSSYLWNTGETTRKITVNKAGTYTVKVTNSSGCENSGSTLVKEYVAPEIQEIRIINNIAQVILSKEGNFEFSLDQVQWQDSNSFENLKNGNYTVYVRAKGGCFIGQKGFTFFYISNSFTPNGDGINDTWKISGIENYPGSEITVTDRYGNTVLKQLTSGTFEWKGASGFRQMPTGTYWYELKVSDGRVFRGFVLLKNRE